MKAQCHILKASERQQCFDQAVKDNKEVTQLRADLAKAKERITELEAALRPFAEAYNRDKGLPATMGGNNWGASWESYEDAAALMGDGDKAQEGDDEKETG